MAAGNSASTNLLDPLKVLWRRRWVIIVCVIVAVLGMAALDSVRTPVYRAQGSIQFTDKAALAGRGVQTDVFLLNSSAVASSAWPSASPLPCSRRPSTTRSAHDPTSSA